MEDKWKTTVTELFTIFRGALISIIPWIEKAKINWKEGDYYDDWDNIVSVLYYNIVCSSLYGEVADEYILSKYAFEYSNYLGMDFILVRKKDFDDNKLAFVSFQSINSPLDSIKVAILDDSYKTVDYIKLKLDDLEFSFVKNTSSTKEILTDIEVIL